MRTVSRHDEAHSRFVDAQRLSVCDGTLSVFAISILDLEHPEADPNWVFVRHLPERVWPFVEALREVRANLAKKKKRGRRKKKGKEDSE